MQHLKAIFLKTQTLAHQKNWLKHHRKSTSIVQWAQSIPWWTYSWRVCSFFYGREMKKSQISAIEDAMGHFDVCWWFNEWHLFMRYAFKFVTPFKCRQFFKLFLSMRHETLSVCVSMECAGRKQSIFFRISSEPCSIKWCFWLIYRKRGPKYDAHVLFTDLEYAWKMATPHSNEFKWQRVI